MEDISRHSSLEMVPQRAKQRESQHFLDCAIVNILEKKPNRSIKEETVRIGLKKIDRKRLKYRSNLLLEYEEKR